jgi:glutamate-1-semialdehyde 2,1-aminomutase
MDAGIPASLRGQTLRFRYNDLDGLRALFRAHPERIAAVMLEPARTEEPAGEYLRQLQALCKTHGAVLIFDEMITGFRWHLGGAQKAYGVVPDLSTFGKALANGFALSALCGRRELMRLGGREADDEHVFLLSTTHGAEVPSLAAGLKTIEIYKSEPVIEHLYRSGERLAAGLRQCARRHGLEGVVEVVGRPCCLLYVTRGPDGQPSQEFRALFLQETIRRGVLAPSFVVSYSHTDADIDRTIEAVDGALATYARALADGVERHLVGRPTRVVFQRNP